MTERKWAETKKYTVGTDPTVYTKEPSPCYICSLFSIYCVLINMVNYKEYECESCGYTVTTNSRGKDMVMMEEIYSYNKRTVPLLHTGSCGTAQVPVPMTR